MPAQAWGALGGRRLAVAESAFFNKKMHMLGCRAREKVQFKMQRGSAACSIGILQRSAQAGTRAVRNRLAVAKHSLFHGKMPI